MRAIYQPAELIVARALYDGLIVAEACGVTLESHPEVMADRLATGIVGALAHSCDPALLYKLLAVVGGRPAPRSSEQRRGLRSSGRSKQLRRRGLAPGPRRDLGAVHRRHHYISWWKGW